MQNKVDQMKSRNIQHVFQALIDEENGKVDFYTRFRNPFLTPPACSRCFQQRDEDYEAGYLTLIEEKYIPIRTLNFLNLDIQGVELRALKSMEKYLQHVQYIYTEVNTEQVYKGCDLVGDIDLYLAKYGFARVCTSMCGNYGWGDAFYVKKKLNNQ